jgi:hypothetical protein
MIQKLFNNNLYDIHFMDCIITYDFVSIFIVNKVGSIRVRL